MLHGLSTLTLSLPAGWVKKFNIKKGDELNLEERGNELEISTEKDICPERKQVDIENFKRLGKTYISASYRQGHDEIEVHYNDPDYIKTIQELISKEMIGFEIIKQTKNNCVIKDLTGHTKDEFNIALRRIWLLIIDLSKEVINAFQKNDADLLRNIRTMDYSINKFSNYCLRILIKKNIDCKKSPLYYHLIKNLEEIADKYKDLCRQYLDYGLKSNKNLTANLIKINEYLNETYELFYKYEKSKIEDLFKKTKLTYENISNSKKSEAIYLSQICRSVRDLLSSLIEINL